METRPALNSTIAGPSASTKRSKSSRLSTSCRLRRSIVQSQQLTVDSRQSVKEKGKWKLETGNSKPENGNRLLEMQNPRSPVAFFNCQFPFSNFQFPA